MGLFDLGIKLLSGGVTGYLTNNFAIKMLFKKYGPLGGVILKTRKEFIHNTSVLIEKDIINHHTIEKELLKTEFQDVFKKIVADIFNFYLFKNTGDMSIGDVPGGGKSLNNTINFYEKYNKTYIEGLMNIVLPNTYFKQIFSDKQIDTLVDKFSELLVQRIQDSTWVETFFVEVARELDDKVVTEFISEKLLSQILGNLLMATNNIHQDILPFRSKVEEAFEKIYSELRIKEILKDLEIKVKSRTLAEIMGQDKSNVIGEKLIQRLTDYLNTDLGEELLRNFFQQILGMLKEISVSLIDFMGSSLQKNVETFIVGKLPLIIEGVISWIEENRDEIEKMLEDAIEETLGEESVSFFAGKLKKYLYDIFLKGKTVNSFQIISKMIEGLEKKADTQAISVEITNEILKYIKTRNIGEIFQLLENKGIISVNQLVELTRTNLEGLLGKLNTSLMEKIWNKPLGDVITYDLTQNFAEVLKRMLYSKLTDGYLYSEKLTAQVQREIVEKYSTLSQAKLSQILIEDKLQSNAELFKSHLVTWVTENKEKVVRSFCHSISKFLEGQRLSVTIDGLLKEEIRDSISKSSLALLKSRLEELKGSKIGKFLDQLKGQHKLTEDIASIILKSVQQNLHILLEGRIEQVVENNLSGLADDDVLKMVEDFIGRELKPITYFGGLIGLIAAGLLYILQGYMGSDQLLRIPLSVFTYGFVGYITNVIALKMIFRPYEEKFIFGRKVPFTPGVIAREKPRFAIAMGTFVGENLLNKEIVEEIFKKNREKIQSNFYRTVSLDNYSRVENYLSINQNVNFIKDKIHHGILNLSPKTRAELIEKFVFLFQNKSLLEFKPRNILPQLKKQGESLLLTLPEYVENYLTELSDTTTPGEILPDIILQNIYQVFEQTTRGKVHKLMELIRDDDKFDELMRDLEPVFNRFKENKIDELFTEVQKEKLILQILKYILDYLRSTEVQGKIVNLAQDKFLKELSSGKTIGELFDGKLINNLKDNSEGIIFGVLNKIIEYLGDQRENVIQMAITIAQKEGGLLFTIGKFLKVDITIANVIHRLIDEKLPDFLEMKKSGFVEVADDFINRLEESRVGDLGIDLSREGFTRFLDVVTINPILSSGLTILVESVLKSLFQIKFGVLIDFIDIKDLSKVKKVFDKEINEVKTQFCDSIILNQEMIIGESSTIIQKVFTDLILRLPLTTFLKGLDPGDIKISLARSVELVTQTQAFNKNLNRGLEELMGRAEEKLFSEILDLELLSQDLLRTLNNLLKNYEVQAELKRLVGVMVVDFLENWNRIFDRETKDYILKVVIGSVLDSLEENFLDLVNSVNIKEVTRVEVNNMGADKIEKLFESFAGEYFRKLESYGWIGSVFGLVELLKMIR